MYDRTIYELKYGASGHVPETARYFGPTRHTDAVTRLAEVIVWMDRNPGISAAWAHLSRLPDSIYPEGLQLVGWTKTSDEGPAAGALTPETAR